MKHGIVLTLLGIAQVVFAYTLGPMAWLLGWSGLSWIIVGGAYGFGGAVVFGKTPHGNMAWWSVCLLFPYLAVTWLLWYVQTRWTKEACCDEIAPGLWLGRRCTGDELPSGIKLVVDLTAEFWEPKGVRENRTYLCVPTLDASVPSLKAFQQLIQTISDFREPVYLHCALGHGRSAAVAIAVLLAKGRAVSLDQAEQRVRQARPGIKINAVQRHLLRQWAGLKLHF